MRLAPILFASFVALFACDARAPQAVPRSLADIRRSGNHLVGDPSVYLEEHAHNPVDWYPWSAEALARAKRENKPIFLSIGYATCHWCHVMAKECFEDDEVAKKLNDGFVAIKVDREQRPDLDAFYERVALDLGAPGGWPLTMVLTPDLEPFFAATVLPKHGAKGRAGLVEVLDGVSSEWAKGGADLKQRGQRLMARIKEAAAREAAKADVNDEALELAMGKIARARDDLEGGFGARQKFFDAPLLLAELRASERFGDVGARAHVMLTLEKAMRGGVHDPISGAFHRYAIDRRWHLPHFEETLVDNAQLASLYLEAARALGRSARAVEGGPSGQRQELERTARAVLDDLIAEWQRPDGGMIAGFDADDANGEGAFYTFTPTDLRAALGLDDARIVGAAFGVKDGGEASLGGRSVLDASVPEAAVAKSLGVGEEAVRAAIARSLPKLRAVRAVRPKPRADDEELTAWNGLALIAFADAARWLGDARYLDAAERVAAFLADRAFRAREGKIARGLRAGASLGPGFTDDLALAALGLLHLHAADGDLRWLVTARAMADAILRGEGRPRDVPIANDDDDAVMPSAASASALLFVTLAGLGSDKPMEDAAEKAIALAGARVRDEPFSSGAAWVAADVALSDAREMVIAGDANDERTRALLALVLPIAGARAMIARLPSAGPSPDVARLYPSLEGKSALGGKPTAFVCTKGICEAPTSDPAELEKKLEDMVGAPK